MCAIFFFDLELVEDFSDGPGDEAGEDEKSGGPGEVILGAGGVVVVFFLKHGLLDDTGDEVGDVDAEDAGEELVAAGGVDYI